MGGEGGSPSTGGGAGLACVDKCGEGGAGVGEWQKGGDEERWPK